ncbi:MAG: hypothetical protein IH840_15735 [Candidatus Heimdallarchaeota archaeon]|nr:hypothetical protein [Candidatus Heimdallarchaeota archaeon]
MGANQQESELIYQMVITNDYLVESRLNSHFGKVELQKMYLEYHRLFEDVTVAELVDFGYSTLYRQQHPTVPFLHTELMDFVSNPIIQLKHENTVYPNSTKSMTQLLIEEPLNEILILNNFETPGNDVKIQYPKELKVFLSFMSTIFGLRRQSVRNKLLKMKSYMLKKRYASLILKSLLAASINLLNESHDVRYMTYQHAYDDSFLSNQRNLDLRNLMYFHLPLDIYPYLIDRIQRGVRLKRFHIKYLRNCKRYLSEFSKIFNPQDPYTYLNRNYDSGKYLAWTSQLKDVIEMRQFLKIIGGVIHDEFEVLDKLIS